jgi:hypothetical protein
MFRPNHPMTVATMSLVALLPEFPPTRGPSRFNPRLDWLRELDYSTADSILHTGVIEFT